jgi:tetratricopeptide (TPR) repeat protein
MTSPSWLFLFYFAAVKAIALFLLSGLWISCSTPSGTSITSEDADTITQLVKINNLLRSAPNDSVLYRRRAEIHLSQGDWREALFDLDHVLQIDSTRGDIYVKKADILMAQKEFGRAKIMLDEAIYKLPAYVPMLLKASEIWLLAGNLEECINWANSALGFDPNNAQGYYLKGMAYRDLKDTVKAVSNLQTSIEQDPKHYEAAMQLGRLFERAKHPRAEAYYNLAVTSRPESLDARYAFGMFLQANGKPEKALEQYDAILQLDSGYVQAFYNKGYIILLHLERADSAHFYFDKAAQMAPQYADAVYMRGYCMELLGRVSEAVLDYREALRLVPHHDLAARGLNRLGV